MIILFFQKVDDLASNLLSQSINENIIENTIKIMFYMKAIINLNEFKGQENKIINFIEKREKKYY